MENSAGHGSKLECGDSDVVLEGGKVQVTLLEPKSEVGRQDGLSARPLQPE
jgi:hypothetical protein